MNQKKPLVLIIMDGLGIAPPSDSNGVSLAKMANFDKYIANFPVYTLMASGEAVGLSWGEIGNSEVGHINLGVGKIFFQNLPRIDKTIADDTFDDNEALKKTMMHVKTNKSNLHVMGLLSDGKVHSVISHLFAVLEMAKKNKIKKVYVHCFLDGRDSIYNSGIEYMKELQEKMKKLHVGQVATISGRFYAMDRDNHWERIQKTYQAMVAGQSERSFEDPLEAIQASYDKKIYDEEFIPTVIAEKNQPIGLVQENDGIIFYNFRADRARQLTKAFVADGFQGFERKKINNLFFTSMIDYEKGLPVEVAFPKEEIDTSLGSVISDAGLSQYHIAETEKYAHVTFFFNGGQEKVYKGEDRDVIPSPRVASYAEKPEMSALQVTNKLSQVIMQEKHDFFVVNYANTDMVAHTGEIEPTVKAIQTVDKCIGQIIDLTLSKGGTCLLTADHGNCEELRNLQTGEISKDHSTNPVPLVLIGEQFRGQTNKESQLIGNDLSLLQPVGLLSDIPATILKLMNIDLPGQFTGRPLI